MQADVADLIKKLVQFRDARDWGKFHSLKNLAVALSIEAGELLELVQWKSDEELEGVRLDDASRQKFSGELADILSYLLLICEKLGIDPIEAASDKIKSNELRYPVEKARGTAAKYSEL